MFLIEYAKKYKVTYISVVAIFLIGICIGIFVTFKIPKNEKENVNGYLKNTIQIIKDKNIDKSALFKEKLLNNLKDVRDCMVIRMYYYC